MLATEELCTGEEARHVTYNWLEESQRQDGETQLRMRIIPNSEACRLLSKPDPHTSGNDVDDIAEYLADGVNLKNDWVFEIEAEENGERGDEHYPDQRG